jgi:glycosyltransferase involved in cell wall biosynthesis
MVPAPITGMRRRLLLLTQFAPARDAQHGSVRVVHGLVSALAERHDVLLVHLGEGGEMDPALAARCAGVEVLHPPALGRWPRRAVHAAALARGRTAWAGQSGIGRVRRRVRWLCERWQPHVVQVEHGMLGETLAGALPGQLRIVTVYDPASSRREYLGLHSEGLPLAQRVDAWAAVRQERRVLRLADAAVVFTERDRLLLAETAPPGTDVVTVPIGADVPSEPIDGPEARPPVVLFVGSYRHPPNTDAALRLVRQIMPLVWMRHPEATVELVGELPPPEIRALDGPAVRVTGLVPSVAVHLARAAVVTAPLRLGGGMRVKVVEALAAGKAVVSTALGAEGLAARHGQELLIADTDQALADAICSLLDDEAERRRLGHRAHAWAAREVSWRSMADRYDDLYERLADRAGRTHARRS